MAASSLIVPLKRRKVNAEEEFCDEFLKLEDDLCRKLSPLVFSSPITHVYNPLEYARETHEDYVKKYCKAGQKVLFLGMNPGPFGMAQNGVPFGDTKHVVDWLKIKGSVEKPVQEHPKRLIHGLDCTRAEVSGSRLWGFFQEHCKSPETFFANCFIHNYCPLVFMKSSGKNVTPPQLPKKERETLLELCDKSLADVVKLMGVKIVVGVGKFAEERAQKALKDSNVEIYSIMHPSPASPAANSGWNNIALTKLTDLDLMCYIKNEHLNPVLS